MYVSPSCVFLKVKIKRIRYLMDGTKSKLGLNIKGNGEIESDEKQDQGLTMVTKWKRIPARPADETGIIVNSGRRMVLR